MKSIGRLFHLPRVWDFFIQRRYTPSWNRWLREGETEVKKKKKKEEKKESKRKHNKAKNRDGWMDFHSFISHVPATLACLLERQWPARRHQAHSKSWPNYGQMRGSSLCLRTKPEVTQLVFKGSSHSRGWGEGGPVGGGGDQLVINIYLVSYWKENLQFVCHPLIQVVGLVVAKHQNRERERGQPVWVWLPEMRNLTNSYMKATCHPLV